MMPKRIHKIIPLLLISLLLKGCVEPYEIETLTFEKMLVVEATITNEFIHQEIKLSHSSPLEEQEIVWESGANVKIVDDAQNIYFFEEADTLPGRYVSVSKFAAQPNRKYHLEIETSNGKSYSSEPTLLVTGAEIDGLRAIRTKNGKGEDGIALLLDSHGNSSYYRYKYEETYKIVSNYAIAKDLIFTTNEDGDPIIAIVAKTKEEYICYNTDYSRNIILSNTNALSENKLNDFLVRFIHTGNPVISHRYSILVKQYAIGTDAFLYYQAIKDLGVSESLFSQSQPGFVASNIFSVENPEEKVIGFFSISSVASKRIFFNNSDFYDDSYSQPSFATECQPMRPSIKSLPAFIRNDNYRFYAESPPPINDNIFPPSNYEFVNAGCVDCTVFGSNKVPEFWVED